MEFFERKIEHNLVRSLVWQDDDLIDWVGGGTRFGMDGSITPASVLFAGDFDAALSTTSGDIVVVYKRLGTKAIVLENHSVVREINRSYYCADVYEYPICLWEREGKPTAIIHCPDEYNQLEIEDALTGERHACTFERDSDTGERDSPDFFHSRLSVNSSGTHLMSAGWFWHPMDLVNIYDLSNSDGVPDLDNTSLGVNAGSEISTCAWLNDESLLTGNSSDSEEEGELDVKGALGAWSIQSQKWVKLSAPEVTLGTLMPLGEDHVVSFYEHPKLIRISDGAVVKEWSHIDSGKQTSSIIHHIDDLPPIAIDPKGMRFAVANEGCIYMVALKE